MRSLNGGLQGTKNIEMMSEENAYKWHTGLAAVREK